MKSNFKFTGLLLMGTCVLMLSCTQQKASQQAGKNPGNESDKVKSLPVKDGPAIGSIETDSYVMKLHQAFGYEPKADEVLANIRPKQGFRFIYLDVSLANKSNRSVNGGELFIGLKVNDEKGTEYRKPAVALAVYCSENPGAQNKEEYNALWETLKPGDFHRAIIYAVEVPVGVNSFTLSLPVDRKRKEWRDIKFTV